jgi:hypothetical protein
LDLSKLLAACLIDCGGGECGGGGGEHGGGGPRPLHGGGEVAPPAGGAGRPGSPRRAAGRRSRSATRERGVEAGARVKDKG